jgi:hypothetical protein
VDLKLLLLRIAAMLLTWVIICPQEKRQEFSRRLETLKNLASRLPRLLG